MASDAIDPSYRSSSSSELRVLSHYTFIRSKISSNIEDLDLLHQIYSWIPNNESIRPNPDILAKKRLKCQEILAIWESFKDYILHTVFKKHHMFVNNKYQAVNDRVYGKKIFVPNEFPYNLSSGKIEIISLIYYVVISRYVLYMVY